MQHWRRAASRSACISSKGVSLTFHQADATYSHLQVLSEFNIPRNISLGETALGSVATHVVELRSGVPVEFEFRLTPVKTNPALTVSPLSGTLKGEEPIRLSFSYRPNDFVTALAVYRVHCSQFNFQPFDVTISGHSRPGAVLERMSKSVKRGEELLRTAELNAAAVGNMRGAGAGASFDPGTVLLEKSLARSKVRVAAREAKQLAVQAAAVARGEGIMQNLLAGSQDESVVDGLRVPRALSGQGATNYILTQAPGKLKPKDIPLAVASHRSIMKKQSSALEATASAQQLQPSAAGPHLSLQQVLAQAKASSWAVRAAVWAGGIGFSESSRQGLAQSDARTAHIAQLQSNLRTAQEQYDSLSSAQKAKSARTWNASLGKTSELERSARLSVVALDGRIKSLHASILREQAILQAQQQAAAAKGRGDFDVDVSAMIAALRSTPPGNMHPLEEAVALLGSHGSVQLTEASGASLPGCTSPYAGQIAAAMNAHQRSTGSPATFDENSAAGGSTQGAVAAAMQSRDAAAGDALTLRRALLSSTTQTIRTAEQDRRTLSKVPWVGEPQWPSDATQQVHVLRNQLRKLEALITVRAADRQSHTTLHGGEVSASRRAAKVARAPAGPVALVLPPSGVPLGLLDAPQRAEAAQAGLDDTAAAAEVAARRAAVDCLRDLLATRIVRDRGQRRLGSLRRRLAHVWRIAGNDPAARRAAVLDLVQKDEQHAAASRDASSTWLAVQPAALPREALVPVPPKARAAGGGISASHSQLILGQNIVPRIQEAAVAPVPDADTDALTVSASTAAGAFAQAQQRTKEAFKAGGISIASVGPGGSPAQLSAAAEAVGMEAPVSISGSDLWPVLRHLSHTGASELAADALSMAVAQTVGASPLQVVARQLQLQSEQHSGSSDASALAGTAPKNGTLTALRASSTVIGQPQAPDSGSLAAALALQSMGGVSASVQHSAACDAAAWWADEDVPTFDMQHMHPAVLDCAVAVPMSLVAPTPPLCLGQPLRAGSSHADNLNASLAGVTTSALQPLIHGASSIPQPVPGLVCVHRFALQAAETLRCSPFDAAGVMPDMRWVCHAPLQAAYASIGCAWLTSSTLAQRRTALQDCSDSAGLLSRLQRVIGELGTPQLRQWLPSKVHDTPRILHLDLHEGASGAAGGLQAASPHPQRPDSLSFEHVLGLHSARCCHPSPPVPPSTWEPLLQFVRGGLPSAASLQLPVLDASGAADVDAPSTTITGAVGSLRFQVQQRWRSTGVLVDGIRMCGTANTGVAAQVQLPEGAIREAKQLLASAEKADSDAASDHSHVRGHALVVDSSAVAHESICGSSIVHSGAPVAMGAPVPPASVAHSLNQTPTASFPTGSFASFQSDPFSPMFGCAAVSARRDAASGTLGCAVAMGGTCDTGMWQSMPLAAACSGAELDWCRADACIDAGTLGEMDASAIGQAELPAATGTWLSQQEAAEVADSSPEPTLPELLAGMLPAAAMGGLSRESLGSQLAQLLVPADGKAAAPKAPPRPQAGFMGACWPCSGSHAVHATSSLSDDSESDGSGAGAAQHIPTLKSLAQCLDSAVQLVGAPRPFPTIVRAPLPWACHSHGSKAVPAPAMSAFPWHKQCLQRPESALSTFVNMMASATQHVLAASVPGAAMLSTQQLLALQSGHSPAAHLHCPAKEGCEDTTCLPVPQAANTCPSALQRVFVWLAFVQFATSATAWGVLPQCHELSEPQGAATLPSHVTASTLQASKAARSAALRAALPGPLFAPLGSAARVCAGPSRVEVAGGIGCPPQQN